MNKMVEEYLEQICEKTLLDRELIGVQRKPVYYVPKEGWESYRRITGRSRRFAMGHAKKMSVAGLIAAAGIGYCFKNLVGGVAAGGIGVASLVGLLTSTGKIIIPFDRMLLRNPNLIARRQFRDMILPWDETYNKLSVSNKGDLDACVLMVQTPKAVSTEFPYQDHLITLGISTSKIADILSDISLNGGIKGLKLENVVQMIMDQKIAEDSGIKFTDLLKLTPSKIAKYMRSKDSDIPEKDRKYLPQIAELRKIIDDYEFTLRVPGMESDCLCAQLSRGHVVSRSDAGINTFAYAGLHSEGQEYPRFTAKGGVGHSFMTKALRGYGVVQGKAQHKFMEKCSGGIGIVRLTVEGTVQGMDDYNWPAIAISVEGFSKEPEDGDNKNGLVVSLNRNILVSKPPYTARYIDGKMDLRQYKNVREAEIATGKLIKEYINRWHPRIAA